MKKLLIILFLFILLSCSKKDYNFLLEKNLNRQIKVDKTLLTNLYKDCGDFNQKFLFLPKKYSKVRFGMDLSDFSNKYYCSSNSTFQKDPNLYDEGYTLWLYDWKYLNYLNIYFIFNDNKKLSKIMINSFFGLIEIMAKENDFIEIFNKKYGNYVFYIEHLEYKKGKDVYGIFNHNYFWDDSELIISFSKGKEPQFHYGGFGYISKKYYLQNGKKFKDSKYNYKKYIPILKKQKP